MSATYSFHDRKHRIASLRDALADGFLRDPKTLPPKFFYDERGSGLFEDICRQPEYYLPGAEREILRDRASEIAEEVGRGGVVVEPGAGSGEKVKILLDALRPVAYVPMDISGEFLAASARRLATEYAWLQVHACCTDFTRDMRVPDSVPDAPRLAFFPGSSLGNFDPPEAMRFLGGVAHTVGEDGRLLIGVDNKKDRDVLDAAYNDQQGLTAAFNLNLLTRINRELGADFDQAQFRHHAAYEPDRGRVEMYLVSRRRQTVRISGGAYTFREGERIHTENSYKYTPGEFEVLAREGGFRLLRHWVDRKDLFSVYLLEAAPGCGGRSRA